MSKPESHEGGSVRLAAFAVLAVLLLFLVIIVIGGPITHLGNRPDSMAYALGVYSPVLIACWLAARKSRRGSGSEDSPSA